MDNLFDEEINTELYIILTLIFLMFYAILSAFLEHFHWPIHRSAVAIIIGIIVGFILFISSNKTYQVLVKLNDTIVFSILFPPMVFTQGIMIKKQALLKNMKFIGLYGIWGTFIVYIVVTLLIYAANQLNMVRDAKDINNIRVLSAWEILLLSACLCSIDSISSEQAVSSAKFPRLYYTIYGEGIFKDTITIVLFHAIFKLQQMENPGTFVFYWYTVFQILLNFLITIIQAIVFGIVFGFLVTFMFKKCRFLLHDKGISETIVLFISCFIVYLLAEFVGSSGVITILIFGILLNHYNSYNLSEEGSENSNKTFLQISVICEGILFLIMGMMVWQVSWSKFTDDDESQITHSWIFIFIVILILIVGRILNIYLLQFMVSKVNKKFKFHRQQVFILFFSGLVRGATPFALFTSVQISDKSQYGKNEGLVLKTTIIIIVILTSVFLNSIIPTIYKKFLLRLENYRIQDVTDQIKLEKFEKHQKKWQQIEEKYIKPFFIFNYVERKQLIEQTKRQKKEEKMLSGFKQQAREQLLHELKNQNYTKMNQSFEI